MVVDETVCRAQEDLSSMKRKLERYKSKELTSCTDEILLEEIRTYKVQRLSHCQLSSPSILSGWPGQVELPMLQH